jgi:hypothetical protein
MRLTTLAVLPFLLFPILMSAADDPRIELRPVATGLDMPVAITHAGDARLFVTLQRGRILIVDAAGTREFLNITSIVLCCGERGLLSVAFHPRYAENGFFYVYYTDAEGDIVIARYQRSGDPDRADPNSRTLILEIPHREFANHNGGQLQFGPDGYLYIGTGDGGGGGDSLGSGQRLDTLLGKMLRIDIDGAAPYTVPSSNPFVGRAGARPEIWAFGLRNPWRFSFDRITSDLWIADVGQGAFEEVNLQPATSTGGENYGWNRMEGAHCFSPASGCNDGSLTLPVLEYGRENNACSVTGGYRYRGARNTRLRGTYIFGDYCNGIISGATQQADGTWAARSLIDTSFLISAFGEDLNGEIYVAEHRGAIYHLVDTAPLLPRRRAVRR